ncbi:MAG: hypothetical protein K2R93_12175 [Gemmatimonadaceae bacterium]|nr:hypothetical protein [Gemmatimonadaceae bacterium]
MILPTPHFGDFSSDASTVGDPTGGARLRLLASRLERAPAGVSRVVVEFAHVRSDDVVVGRQEGTACPGGDLRLAALATFEALTRAADGAIAFDLIGVKPVRAFDTTVMMVAAVVRQDGTATRVVGAAIADGSEIEATVRASLHAVNRLVSPLLGPLPVRD